MLHKKFKLSLLGQSKDGTFRHCSHLHSLTETKEHRILVVRTHREEVFENSQEGDRMILKLITGKYIIRICIAFGWLTIMFKGRVYFSYSYY
jgi:hypothetical protein